MEGEGNRLSGKVPDLWIAGEKWKASNPALSPFPAEIIASYVCSGLVGIAARLN
jgi:hypothetical protein